MTKLESFSKRPEFKRLSVGRRVAIASFLGTSIKHARTNNDWNVSVTSLEVRRRSRTNYTLELVPIGSVPPQDQGLQEEIFMLGNILNEFKAAEAASKHGVREEKIQYVSEANKDKNMRAVKIGEIDLAHITERQRNRQVT